MDARNYRDEWIMDRWMMDGRKGGWMSRWVNGEWMDTE